MKVSKLVKGLLTTIFIAALAVPAIASTGDRNELKGVSMKVSFADFNVDNKKDAKTLDRRLKQASRYVCDYRCLNAAGLVLQGNAGSRC